MTWDDRDDIPATSLPAKFRMPDIERYSGIGCPKIHLRLYSIVIRARGIDDAQLVALSPCHLVEQLGDGLPQLSRQDFALGRMWLMSF